MISEHGIKTPSNVAKQGANNNLLMPLELIGKLKQLTLGSESRENNVQLNKLIHLLDSGEKIPLSLQKQLTMLLNKGNDSNNLEIDLSKLFTSLGLKNEVESVTIKPIANLLLGKLNNLIQNPDNKLLMNQSILFLKLVIKNTEPAVLKEKLSQLMTQLKNDTTSLIHQPIDKDLKKYLQQMMKEGNNTQQSGMDNQFVREMTEFVLRLNQKITESETIKLSDPYFIQGQQQQQQQQQQQKNQQQQSEDEETLEPLVFNAARSTQVTKSTITYESTIQNRNSLGLELYSGNSIFSSGLSVLFLFMEVLSEQANGKFADMEMNSAISRDAQKHASTIDGVIADVAGKGNSKETGTLPSEVEKYIEENKLEISGVCGYDDSGNWRFFSNDNPKKYKQGELTAIKGALDNVANRASDFISTSQLQLQKMMQTYNVCVSLINSMQTMLADMNKTIAQGIR